MDCLIARVAIEHELTLVHDDRDFELMAGVVPELQLYPGALGGPPPPSEVGERTGDSATCGGSASS